LNVTSGLDELAGEISVGVLFPISIKYNSLYPKEVAVNDLVFPHSADTALQEENSSLR
jgi:hypothetical protein